MHSLTPKEISNVVYAFGQNNIANRRLMQSYKKAIDNKISGFEYNSDSCHKILLGWVLSRNYTAEDQEFWDKLLNRILQDLESLRPEQLTKLYYNIYGKNLAALEFEYKPEIEEEIYKRAESLDFPQLVQVLATFKFIDKKVGDERLEQAIKEYIPKMIPQETAYFLRYFLNSKTDMGFSDGVYQKLESTIMEDAGEMNADELSVTYSSLALSK